MSFDTISFKELDNYVNKSGTYIIDLRSRKDFLNCHIVGAVNIPFEIMENYDRIGKDNILVFYCERGNLSMIAAKQFSEKGYRVISLVGGLHAYRGNNLVFQSRN